ncbi:hypothetical protein [Veillonella criceti]|uniref:Phage transcriptional regulator, RinA family n=1 Tax=Veillonella criceti TaxID=103891 RepID=A0A380NJ79_9FIRM|nr:hypothetical protein [Veillonella criceti]SUP42280.1 Uncharacterised protein [Veillonella criceti]
MDKFIGYENDRAKERLIRVRGLGCLAKELQLTVDDFNDNPQRLTAMLSAEPRGGSKGKDIGDTIVKYQKLTDKLLIKLKEVLHEYKDILAEIDSMENPEFSYLLHAYYINCKTWKQIAQECNYSWRHIMRIKELALEQFQREKMS